MKPCIYVAFLKHTKFGRPGTPPDQTPPNQTYFNFKHQGPYPYEFSLEPTLYVQSISLNNLNKN